MMGLEAMDLMIKDVVTIDLDTPVPDIARMFIDHQLGSLPVMESKQVKGIVTIKNLLKLFLPRHVKFLDIMLYFENSDNVGVLLKRARGLRAEDIMNLEIVSVKPDAGFASIVALLFEKKVHQLLVMDGANLKGIISRLDIIKAFENHM